MLTHIQDVVAPFLPVIDSVVDGNIMESKPENRNVSLVPLIYKLIQRITEDLHFTPRIYKACNINLYT